MRPSRFRRIAGRVVIAWEAIVVGLIFAFVVWLVGLSAGWWG